ncbi:MAG: 6-phosphofructokinase [Armatimonadota bacterium]
MEHQLKKIGVFVAGGPAAGINGVLKGIVQEAENSGLRVLGFLNGAHGLVHGRFEHLTRARVENIQILGGSILGTSRHQLQPEAGDLTRILAHLERQGVEGLVSIGGEGTLQLADTLRRIGVRIVHVPKTIDNDIAGVSQSFGFDTAVYEATRMLTAIKLDAEASGSWFVVEIMGRFTGHLALEAGLAAGCTRVLVPEEGPIQFPDLLGFMKTRLHAGQNWGVILVAESAHFGDGHVMREERLGGIAEQLAVRLQEAVREENLPFKIRTSDLGYFLRCAEPTGYDRAYAAKLGVGAARYIQDPCRAGHMVVVEDDCLQSVPIERVAGVLKRANLLGARYQSLLAVAAYESAQMEARGRRQVWQAAAETLSWLGQHADLELVQEVAMRLGLPPETLLEVLQEAVSSRTASPRPGATGSEELGAEPPSDPMGPTPGGAPCPR